MSWTETVPTEPGRYWWRTEEDNAEILCLQPHKETGQLFASYWTGGSGRLAAELTGEWWPEAVKPPGLH